MSHATYVIVVFRSGIKDLLQWKRTRETILKNCIMRAYFIGAKLFLRMDTSQIMKAFHALLLQIEEQRDKKAEKQEKTRLLKIRNARKPVSYTHLFSRLTFRFFVCKASALTHY